MSFSVYLGSVDPLGGYVWGAEPETLALTPTFWSKNRKGGFLAAEVQVIGAQAHLWDVLTWLRRPVEILGEHGQTVWAGFVNEVQITTGSGVQFSWSLDDMANRIAVAYAAELPGGGYDRGTTDWAEDAASIRRYGIKEYLHSRGQAEDDDALTVRAKLLEVLRKPRRRRVMQGAGGSSEARLMCLGWAETLKWRKWTRTGTRIEFTDVEGAESQAVGWRLTDTDIGFTRNLSAVHDIDGRLQPLREGNKVTVAGSGQSNNGTYTVTKGTDAQAQTYTATTIYFEPDNDIKDTNGGLGFLRKGALMLLMYSPNNSGVHRVSVTGDEAIEVDTTFKGFVVAEFAGPSIYIKQGNEALIYPRPTNKESPGASITITLQGYRIAQRVTLSTAMNVGRVAVQVCRVGSPSDNIRVALYSDSAGSPGSSLSSATISGASLPADDPAWVWFSWSGSGAALSAGTYWIVVERSGGVSATDYYDVGMTQSAYGACKAWTGSAWADNPSGDYLPFKLWSVEETTTTLRGIAQGVGQLIEAVKLDVASGVWANPQQDGDTSAYDVIDKLIDLGTADGHRLFWEVTPDRTLRVYAEPDYDFRPLVLEADGTLRDAGGALVARGELPVGRYLAVADVPEHLDLWPIMIDGAECDGERVQLHPQEDGHVLT